MNFSFVEMEDKKSHSIILKELHQAYTGCLLIKKDIQAFLWLMSRVAIEFDISIYFFELEYVCIWRLYIAMGKLRGLSYVTFAS